MHHLKHSKSFWRGFGSAFDLFPGASRQQARAQFLYDTRADIALASAWEQVGKSLNIALESYEQEQARERKSERPEARLAAG